MAKRSAAGNIRHRKDGRWEARYTVGQSQKSVYGKTQREVRQKLTSILADIDNGTYQEPNRLTLSAWLDAWQKDYLGDVKPRTVKTYVAALNLYVRPALGAVKLQNLRTAQIQTFYNSLQRLSPKTIKNVHGILHRALADAVSVDLISSNPSTACKLPKIERADMYPFDEAQIAAFLKAIQGHLYENVYLVTLFCGLRQGEVLGLTWDCVNFETNTLTVKKQLQRISGSYQLVPTKNSKTRYIKPAKFVMDALRREQTAQKLAKLRAGEYWSNPDNLVFTNPLGECVHAQVVYRHFKKLAADIGAPQARFHDLRHSYAVLALKSGDDIKTVQTNLGHHTAAFTLDTYAYVTEQMKQESAARMDKTIDALLRVN